LNKESELALFVSDKKELFRARKTEMADPSPCASAPPKVRPYLEDVMTSMKAPAGWCDDSSLTGDPVAPGLTEFSGSYGNYECPQGMLGGAEYYRSFRESELARMAPDVLARSVRSTWDEPFLSVITPEKPAAVSLAGYDVFGPQSYHTTTRNMSIDLRGEAAYAPNLVGEVPVGASVSSYAMGAAINYADCVQGCGCQTNPAGIQLAGSVHSAAVGDACTSGALGYSVQQRCADRCNLVALPGSHRAQCLEECGYDSKTAGDVSLAGNNSDLLQGCYTQCAADGGSPEQVLACSKNCNGMFGNSGRGSAVFSVHPRNFFVPADVQSVTVLRPYHC
jgi:hypothetical protein